MSSLITRKKNEYNNFLNHQEPSLTTRPPWTSNLPQPFRLKYFHSPDLQRYPTQTSNTHTNYVTTVTSTPFSAVRELIFKLHDDYVINRNPSKIWSSCTSGSIISYVIKLQNRLIIVDSFIDSMETLGKVQFEKHWSAKR